MYKTIKAKVIRIFVFVLALCCIPLSASAYSVGDTASFSAGKMEAASNGYTPVYTRTQQEQFWDNANYSNNYEVTSVARSQIEVIDKNTIKHYIKRPDRIVVSMGAETPIDVIEKIASKKDKYYPGGYSYETYSNYTGDKNINLNNEQYNALKDVMMDKGFNTIYSADEIDAIIWNLLDEMTASELIDYLNRLQVIGGKVIRKKITGDTDIIDFDTFAKRYEALEMYLQAYAGKDTIKTQYILEIKAESVANTVLWSSVPQTWGVTGQTHYWQFECVDSYDGGYHAATQQFAGPDVSQTFYYPGKYHVSATQILSQTYYNAVSYSINEYWVVAETGQVIWKSESTGSTIPTNNSKPVGDMGLTQVSNYKLVDEGTYYVSMFDQEIEVTTNAWTGHLQAPSVWGYNFSTQRIE